MKKSSLSVLIAMLIFFGSSVELLAQSGPFVRPRIKHFGLEEGLPHRSVLSTTHDHNNVQWITTEGSLCRDEGPRINKYSNFLQNFRGSIRRNDDSLLFVILNAYPDSVEILDPSTQTPSGIRLSKGLVGAFAGARHRDGHPLFFAQGGHIYRYRTGLPPKVVHELKGEIQPGDRLIDASENSYLLMKTTLNQLEEVTHGRRFNVALPSANDSLYLHLDQSQTVWISTPNGLLLKKLGSSELRPGPQLPSGHMVNRIFEDKKGHLILGHLLPNLLRITDLISYYEGEIHDLTWITHLENRIIEINGDEFYKEIEVGSHGGYYRINFPENHTNPFRNYLYDPTLKPGEFGHLIRGFTADNAGNVYANKDSRQPYWFRVNQQDLSLDTLVMKDNTGKVVDQFGCGNNLYNFQGNIYGSSCFLDAVDTTHVYRYCPQTAQWTQWALPETDQKIRWMMEGRTDQEILLITEGTKGKKGNIFYFKPTAGTFEKVLTAGPAYTIDSYAKKAVKDTLCNSIWIGTLTGLYEFDPSTDSLHQYLFPDGRVTEISDIIVDKNGELLLGTFKNGIRRFDPNTKQFKIAGGVPEDGTPLTQSSDFMLLPSNDIAALAVTPKKYFLVTTFNGLSFQDHGKDANSVFTTIDGLPSNEFNTASLFHNITDNRWYAGGINGFTSFHTEDLVRDTSPYEVIFLRTRFLDEKVGYEKTKQLKPSPEKRIIISPSVAYFSLEYTIPDYSDRNPPRFQTQLVGLDNNWRTPEKASSVRYTQLPPGIYTFRIRAIDGSGRTTGEPKELEILVEKPWYQTNLFYFLIALSIALAIIAYVRVREHQLRKDYHSKRRVQQLELQALRQQLNPHFISNAMNAIRDFVYEAQPDQAAVYLNDFARLMRLFLEVSRNRFTTIKDEVELLERYIRLEQLRFKGKFDYKITVHPNIEVGMDEVPSLLLQPIVENAINHGLYHLESGGSLNVAFSLDPYDDEIIICQVSDNGVGRKIAAQKRKANPGHVSRSTQILEDHREVLEEEGNTSLVITTTDLHPDREYTGTVVSVRIEPIERLVH